MTLELAPRDLDVSFVAALQQKALDLQQNNLLLKSFCPFDHSYETPVGHTVIVISKYCTVLVSSCRLASAIFALTIRPTCCHPGCPDFLPASSACMGL